MKELRDKLNNELKGLDRKTINLILLKSIEYFYYSKIFSGKKEEKKKDNKGIREIKKYLFYFVPYLLYVNLYNDFSYEKKVN